MAETQQSNVTSADLAADRAHALDMVPVSRETVAKLDVFVDHLLRVAPHLNLVARSTLPNVWTHHVADSLQLLPLAPYATSCTDLSPCPPFPPLFTSSPLPSQTVP